MIDCRLQRTSESLTVKGQLFPDDWLSSRWWLVERDPTNKPALLPHPPQRSRAAGADFTRLYVRDRDRSSLRRRWPIRVTGDTAYAAAPSGCIGRTSDRSCWRSHSV